MPLKGKKFNLYGKTDILYYEGYINEILCQE